MKKINWLDHLVNLVVVITGISVAFAMNNWKADRDKVKIEIEYLTSLIQDLDKDKNDHDSLITDDSTQLKALIKLFQLNEIGEVDDSVSWSLSQLGTFNSFDAHNTTFESLKNSGRLETLWDLELRIIILENYHTSYNQIFNIEEYFQKNFDNNILPYFINEFSFSLNIQESILHKKFKSIVGLQISFLQQKIEAYIKSRSTTIGLKDKLKERLAKITN